MKNFTQAINREEHEEPFILRAHCYLELGHPDLAIKDANEAIRILKLTLRSAKTEKSFQTRAAQCKLINVQMAALKIKAEILYSIAQFERALVYYYRCVALRPHWR